MSKDLEQRVTLEDFVEIWNRAMDQCLDIIDNNMDIEWEIRIRLQSLIEAKKRGQEGTGKK